MKKLKICLLTIVISLMQKTFSHQLVNIQAVIPDIVLDIRYATTNNFTGKKVYSHPVCFLIDTVAYALKAAQEEFKMLGFKLKIFDGYRPHAMQHLFWDILPDPRYIGDPAKGSKHNRGCAVDLTLTTLDDQDIAMPTEFDDFTEKAHSDYPLISDEVKKNRELLQSVMAKHGFTALPTEWWHFDYKDWQDYPLLDIPLAELIEE